MEWKRALQQTQNICITFVQCWTLGRRCTNAIQMLCACWDSDSLIQSLTILVNQKSSFEFAKENPTQNASRQDFSTTHYKIIPNITSLIYSQISHTFFIKTFRSVYLASRPLLSYPKEYLKYDPYRLQRHYPLIRQVFNFHPSEVVSH